MIKNIILQQHDIKGIIKQINEYLQAASILVRKLNIKYENVSVHAKTSNFLNINHANLKEGKYNYSELNVKLFKTGPRNCYLNLYGRPLTKYKKENPLEIKLTSMDVYGISYYLLMSGLVYRKYKGWRHSSEIANDYYYTKIDNSILIDKRHNYDPTVNAVIGKIRKNISDVFNKNKITQIIPRLLIEEQNYYFRFSVAPPNVIIDNSVEIDGLSPFVGRVTGGNKQEIMVHRENIFAEMWKKYQNVGL